MCGGGGGGCGGGVRGGGGGGGEYDTREDMTTLALVPVNYDVVHSLPDAKIYMLYRYRLLRRQLGCDCHTTDLPSPL